MPENQELEEHVNPDELERGLSGLKGMIEYNAKLSKQVEDLLDFARSTPAIRNAGFYSEDSGAGDRGAGAGPRMIVAPMPGRIVKVLVKPGQSVSARQPLLVVEAMKMENELRAPRGGTVAEVRVAEGSSVEANAVLVVLR